MSDGWQELETSVHQDHVIAHVLETTPLAYLIHDETIHLILDIGFIWSIYLDGQMVLLPHPVAVRELAVSASDRAEIASDLEVLLAGAAYGTLKRMVSLPGTSTITGVDIYEDEGKRLFALRGSDNVLIETSLVSGDIQVRIEN